jgi:hypothetical protein
MLNLTHALRKQIRHLAAPTPRAFHLQPNELKLQPRPPKFEAALTMPDTHTVYKPEPGPNLQLKPVKPNPDVPARQFFDAPPYRAGDGENAIWICLQPYAAIVLEQGSPPVLRVLDPSTATPEDCCKLPGLRSTGLQAHAQIPLEVSLNNTVPLHDIPPVLLEHFWNHLPDSMSREGRAMFAHFNADLPPPTTATDCYQRLQSYVKWLWRLAD